MSDPGSQYFGQPIFPTGNGGYMVRGYGFNGGYRGDLYIAKGETPPQYSKEAPVGFNDYGSGYRYQPPPPAGSQIGIGVYNGLPLNRDEKGVFYTTDANTQSRTDLGTTMPAGVQLSTYGQSLYGNGANGGAPAGGAPAGQTTYAPGAANMPPALAAALAAGQGNGPQMGTGGEFQQAVSQATSSGTVPSDALASNNSTSELLSQMQALYNDYGKYTQELLKLSEPSAEEKALSDQIRQFTTQMEQGIVHIEGQAIPTPLIGLQSQKLKENYAFKIKPLQDQLDSLVESRSSRLDAITRVMQATPTMMAMLETMSKLSQPNVLGTQVNSQTGDVYAMVQNPNGTITTQKVGNIGANKTYQQTGTYQSADGSQYFWGLKPDGTIENIRLQGGANPQEKYVSSYTYQDQNGQQWFFGLKPDGTSDNYPLQGQTASGVQNSQAYISEGSYQGADGKQYFYGVKPNGEVVSFPMSGPGNPVPGGSTQTPTGGNSGIPSGNTSAPSGNSSPPQGTGTGSILNNGSPAPNLNGNNYVSVKAPPNQALEPGMSGAAVSQLQDFLISQGYMTEAQKATGPGVYGPQTTAAVKAWQQANGVDYGSYPGYWGPKSYAAYSSRSGGSSPAPSSSSSSGRTI